MIVCIRAHVCIYYTYAHAHTLTMCGHIHVHLPYCTHIRTFFILLCGWTVLSNPCMHASSHTHTHTNLPMRTKKVTVNEFTRTYTNTLACTRDTDRRTVLIMCAAGFLFRLSLLLDDNSARIDFDGTYLQANHPFFFFSSFRNEK